MCASFLALFRRVGSGDVLFVTGGVGDSARYRCDHVAEELRLNGFRASVTVQDNPFLVFYATKFSIFIFHRTLYTPNIRKLIIRAKEANKEVIFDTDDLVYDPVYLEHMDMWKKMNVFERKQYEMGVGGEIVSDPYVKVCTTTTNFLAEKLQERGKRVIIVPNRLCQKDVEVGENIFSDRGIGEAFHKGDEVTIAYFSGTKSHDKDFAQVSGALIKVLEVYPNTRLFLAGPLNIDEEFARFGDRVYRLAYVPREENFRNIASVDINIAPLERGNPFCESKSELKFFEAGLCGVPTVASATRTFLEAIDDGVDGYTAEISKEWFEKLSQLIESAELRKKIGNRVREKVLKRYTTTSAHNDVYYSYLRSCLKK